MAREIPMYQEFARIYDSFMDDFDYSAWAEYYLALLRSQGWQGGEICECGCGTGSLTIELARRGATLLASDISEDMLRIAADKSRRAGVRARYVRQDMRRLALPHRVGAVLCACDGVNDLLTPGDVRSFFAAAHAALRPGGVLAIDISSRYKLENVLGTGFFGEERESAAYLWQNSYDPEACRVTMDLTFFVREERGLYRRFTEQQVQRAHDAQEILAWLAECGFERAQLYGDRTLELPREDELRLHFTAVKPLDAASK